MSFSTEIFYILYNGLFNMFEKHICSYNKNFLTSSAILIPFYIYLPARLF